MKDSKTLHRRSFLTTASVGGVAAAAGATLADAELGKMNWYAEGILVGNK